MIKVKVLKEFISNGRAIKHKVGDILSWKSVGNFQRMLIDNGFVQPLANIQSTQKTNKFSPKLGERYFTVDTNGDISEYMWEDDEWDHDCYDFGNCFQTEEQAERTSRAIKNLFRWAHQLITEGTM